MCIVVDTIMLECNNPEAPLDAAFPDWDRFIQPPITQQQQAERDLLSWVWTVVGIVVVFTIVAFIGVMIFLGSTLL